MPRRKRGRSERERRGGGRGRGSPPTLTPPPKGLRPVRFKADSSRSSNLHILLDPRLTSVYNLFLLSPQLGPASSSSLSRLFLMTRSVRRSAFTLIELLVVI